jgi:hypothetical protein
VIIDFHHVDRTDKQSVHFLVKNYQFAAAMEEIKEVHPLVRQLPPDSALGGT